MSEKLILAGILLSAVSGLPGLFLRRESEKGQVLAAWLLGCGSLLGLSGVFTFWFSGLSQRLEISWPLPGGGLHGRVDGLSAFFLFPIFLMSLLGNIYGLEYWPQKSHPGNGRKLRLFYGTLTAGMALLVLAQDTILFLFGWEIMALSAFFLVTTEDQDTEVCETGWLYLVATHVATLALIGLFSLLYTANDKSFLLVPTKENLSPGVLNAIWALALVGFGLKAGLMPLHIWLPSSHAIAPSHVSALMSGVIIKMGIYGLVRVTGLLPPPPICWGVTVLALGGISAILGVVFALGQHDLKRLLAYHSIENIGIIVMGLGLALIGRTMQQTDWVLLGLGSCLLHVWNHAFFKGLLFLSAGSILHSAKTRELDLLGGLAKRMPRTSFCFLIGAAAICGLPPLNGFVSELLLYIGLLKTLENRFVDGVALAAPALALAGALAVACFVKVIGTVFLGEPRSPQGKEARESGPCIIWPMGTLAVLCVSIGLFPLVVVPVISQGVAAWMGKEFSLGGRLMDLAPIIWITALGLALAGVLAVLAMVLGLLKVRQNSEKASTWGCAYASPGTRMQYTSSSFSQMIVRLFSWVLHPHRKETIPAELFPGKGSFHSHVPDLVLEQGVMPAFRTGAWLASWLRPLQHGKIQSYLLYVFLALIALFLWG